jgi:hypothetical protein
MESSEKSQFVAVNTPGRESAVTPCEGVSGKLLKLINGLSRALQESLAHW